MLVGNEIHSQRYLAFRDFTDNYLERKAVSTMGMMKTLYQDFLDRAGIDPEDDEDLARFIAEKGGLERAFREYMDTQVNNPSIKRHKTDKIANIEQLEGDWT